MNNSNSTQGLKNTKLKTVKDDEKLQMNELKSLEIIKQLNPEVQTQVEVRTGKRLVGKIMVIFLVSIAALGIGIVLSVKYFQSEITQISRFQLNFDDQSSLQVVSTQIKSNNVFSPKLYLLLDFIFSNHQEKQSNLRQKTSMQDYYISSNSPQTGITFRLSSDSKISVCINIPALINHFLQTNNQRQQLAESSVSQYQRFAFYEKILLTMNSSFSSTINSDNNGQIQFININMVNFKVASGSIEFDNNPSPFPFPPTQQSRKIFIDSITIFFQVQADKLASFIDYVGKNAPLIDKIARKVVNNDAVSSITIKKSDNILNKFLQRMKSEEKTNNKAQLMAKSCIPQTQLKMSCSLSSVLGDSIPFTANYFQLTTSTLISDSTTTSDQEYSMSDDFLTNMGEDSTTIIPVAALQNFAFWGNKQL